MALVGIALTSGLLSSALTTDSGVTSKPESQRAQDLIDERLPGSDALDEFVIVRSGQRTVRDAAYAARVRQLAGELRALADVRSVATYQDPGGAALVSRDGHATLLQIVMRDEPKTTSVDHMITAVQAANGQGGFAVHITGKNTIDRDFTKISESDLQQGELRFGLPAALIVLVVVFGTLVGAAIPVMMAILSIVVAMGLVAAVGQAFQLNIFVVNMLVAMGLALGIDYSLFIVSRLREERHRGASTHEAILIVAGTATRAVVFSGVAFILAMLGMFLMPDATLRSLAVGAIAVALVSILVALTFHPALLMVLGDRVDRLRVPWIGKRIAESMGEEGRFWGGAVRAVVRHPGLSATLACTLLLAAAVPVLGLKLGASGPQSLPDSTVGKQGLIALERDFPTGATTPVHIVVDGPPTNARVQRAITALRGELARDPDFAARATTIQRGPQITVLSLPMTADSASERATTAINRLRDQAGAAFAGAPAKVLVGGIPAENRDYFAMVSSDLPLVIAFVLALSFVLLTLAFRSIVVPLTAIAVNLLSVGAAYGLLVLVFVHGVGADVFGFGTVERIDAWVPVFLFSVLFGLSMDYQVFLLSRIRERYVQTGSTTDGIIHGVSSTARLITGAALIIVVVFTGFATGELVGFQQMGFGVAIALLVDATIVRTVVIPAVMQLLGDRNWYLPRWLEWLPSVNVEGQAVAAAPVAARLDAVGDAGQRATAQAAEPAVANGAGLRLAVEGPDAGRVTMTVAGDLDLSTGDEFAAQIATVERERPATIVIDLRDTAFIDSAGLAQLVGATRRARAEDRRVVLVTGSAAIERVLAVSGADEVLETTTNPTGLD
ncbi:MMPL family transporter [Capillimicrobium parvum]|uniref:MMPL family transporter n=1 Tax=Capillimicrobium parvum TaxID=2884022 RepID=UPI00216B047E|nr:MMPL family transporter [Capillimicrobium parvum]